MELKISMLLGDAFPLYAETDKTKNYSLYFSDVCVVRTERTSFEGLAKPNNDLGERIFSIRTRMFLSEPKPAMADFFFSLAYPFINIISAKFAV